MSCPQEPLPKGWKIWRGPVPTELVQLAVDVLGSINSFPYGGLARVVTYNDQTVGAFKSHHQWTYRNGRLVTGICIPGVSLLIAMPNALAAPLGATSNVAGDSLQTPDPTAAVYSVDAPPETTDWKLVATTAVITVGVVGLFLYGIRTAGKASRQ
jgi:hypothetical protein